ncbi:MAG: NAD(P)H-binding protein [Thermomicrobiales bacterium]
MTTAVDPQPILVVGSTGKTGRRVLARLAERDIPVRHGSRQADPAFDWQDPETWPPALQGVRAIYLTYAPDIALPGAVTAVRAFMGLAADAGVQHVVFLSGRGEDEAQQAETVVQSSGIPWTILRCAWFAQNFSENVFLGDIVKGEVILPAGKVGEPFVDAEDIADVAVAALTEDGHVGRLYELTGPRLLTFAEAVQEIAAATGRQISFQEIPAQAYRAALESAQLPPDLIWLIDYLFTTVLDGRNAYVAHGVQSALQRPPRDFRDYARATAASGIWNTPALEVQ